MTPDDIRQRRRTIGVSALTLAQAANIDRGYLSKLENGKVAITPDMEIRIEEGFRKLERRPDNVQTSNLQEPLLVANLPPYLPHVLIPLNPPHRNGDRYKTLSWDGFVRFLCDLFESSTETDRTRLVRMCLVFRVTAKSTSFGDAQTLADAMPSSPISFCKWLKGKGQSKERLDILVATSCYLDPFFLRYYLNREDGTVGYHDFPDTIQALCDEEEVTLQDYLDPITKGGNPDAIV